MEQIALEANVRNERGREAARKLRRAEQIPAVIYGKETPSLNLILSRRNLAKVLAQGATHKLINLRIDDGGNPIQKLCMIQELQRDVFQKRVLHVDFHQISLTEKITATIPVKLTGDAPGVKNGGVLDHVLWEVDVEALPTALPEELVADISALEIGHSVHVKDLPVSPDVKIMAHADDVVAVVHPPRVEAVETPAVPVEGASAQPEVIGKGKGEEEEAPPGPAGARPDKSVPAKAEKDKEKK